MLVLYTFTSTSSSFISVSCLKGHHLRGGQLPGASAFGQSLLKVSEGDKRPRANSSYMREMTGRMIITHEQLTLLENIGQGARDVCKQTI